MAWKSEFSAGARSILPIVVAAVPIGLVFGTVAATKGLSTLEVVAMSALMFAGGSQFVAIDVWGDPVDWLSLGFTVLLVNIRHVLLGASLVRKMQAFSSAQKYASALFMTDENWAMAEARSRDHILTPAFFAGLSFVLYCAWVSSTFIGAFMGATLGDTTAIALDFAFPALFVVLVVSFWRSSPAGLVLAASAAASLTVYLLVPGSWYIAAGAVAGLTVAFINTSRTPAEVRHEH